MKMTTDDLRMSVHQAGFSHANLIIKTPPSHHYFDRSSVLTSTHCTMCKIAHFARQMGGQNFHKFNAVLTSRDYI